LQSLHGQGRLHSRQQTEPEESRVQYSGPIDYNIRFVLEYPYFEIISFANALPGKEESDPSVVCRLQLESTAAGGPFSVSPYHKYEAESFIKVLRNLSDDYSIFLQKTCPDFTFEMANVLSANGCMNIAVVAYKPAGRTGGSSKTADIVAVPGHRFIEEVAVHPYRIRLDEEDATHRSFRAGIKYYLVAPCGKLASGLKPPRSSVDFLDPPDGDS
jgi:hypothetical protein